MGEADLPMTPALIRMLESSCACLGAETDPHPIGMHSPYKHAPRPLEPFTEVTPEPRGGDRRG